MRTKSISVILIINTAVIILSIQTRELSQNLLLERKGRENNKLPGERGVSKIERRHEIKPLVKVIPFCAFSRNISSNNKFVKKEEPVQYIEYYKSSKYFVVFFLL